MTESVKIDRQELKERNGRDFQDRETGERDRTETGHSRGWGKSCCFILILTYFFLSFDLEI